MFETAKKGRALHNHRLTTNPSPSWEQAIPGAAPASYALSTFLGRSRWTEQTQCDGMALCVPLALQHPLSCGIWPCLGQESGLGTFERNMLETAIPKTISLKHIGSPWGRGFISQKTLHKDWPSMSPRSQ